MMRHYIFGLSNVCITRLEFDLDDKNVFHNVRFTGGCQGNLKALSENLEGESLAMAKEIINMECCKDEPASKQCVPKLKAKLLEKLQNI